MFCAKEKLKTRTSDRLISMIKRRDFVIEDICAETIRELEILGKYFEHDPTRKPSTGLQVPDIPVFEKNARLLLPFVMIVIAVDWGNERLHEDVNKQLATITWHGARGTFHG